MALTKYFKKNFSPKNRFVTTSNVICDELNFAASESYKKLRTNVSFSFADNTGCKVIGITSSFRGEGKSVTAINLSYSLAQEKKKVLLIDADMRLPSITAKLEIQNSEIGLSNLLIGFDNINKILHRYVSSKDENIKFDIITSGELPPNPSELLGSARMKSLLDSLRTVYDYIIIDLPPVNDVTDATVTSKHADAMLVVVRQDYCRTDILRETVQQLNFAGANLIGFVYNGAATGTKRYSRYHRYYYKSYYKSYYKHGYGYYGYKGKKK